LTFAPADGNIYLILFLRGKDPNMVQKKAYTPPAVKSESIEIGVFGAYGGGGGNPQPRPRRRRRWWFW
jgi:hypothetical protein